MDFKKNVNEEGKTEIKLNRKMRMWHKYKNYCITGGGIAVVLLVCVIVFKTFSGKGDKAPEQETPATTAQVTIAQEQPGTDNQESTGTQPTTAAVIGGVYEVSGKAQQVDFTSKDAFADAVFLGDSIISGISYYGYLEDSQVIANGNMTSDKAAGYVDQVLAANPQKVFIMVGLNDANYGTRDADDIVEYIAAVVSDIKSQRPSVNVFVLSLLPVTQRFEARTNVNVKQSVLDEVNQKLHDGAGGTAQYSYIDVASAYKDSTGYLTSDCTGNGSNLNNSYYPFLLNGIAGVLK